MCRVVQKNSTPFRKPRNSGGSPSGVSEPPALATRKMKKTTTCATWRRLSLARSSGRISSIAAPVVPITLARQVPSARIPVFSFGVPCRLPCTQMPPATIYSAPISTMNGMYSASSACTTLAAAACVPKASANGTRNSRPQAAATLPKW